MDDGATKLDLPSTTETIPQRFVGAELNVGELDMGDSSVTKTRCAFAAGVFRFRKACQTESVRGKTAYWPAAFA